MHHYRTAAARKKKVQKIVDGEKSRAILNPLQQATPAPGAETKVRGFQTMKINHAKLAALTASNWSLVIFTPYHRRAQSFFGDRDHMLRLCNCDRGQTLEFVTLAEYEAQKDSDGQWYGEWQGEGYYGRTSETDDYQLIDTDAEEAIWTILSHDSSNNFSWRGNAEQALADVTRHRLIREALETEGVILPIADVC
jgi:hypothetical protein